MWTFVENCSIINVFLTIMIKDWERFGKIPVLLLKRKMKNEAELVKQCKRNKASAQKQIYEHYAPLFKGMCMRYATDEHEAEDMLQEAFIKIFLNIHKFNNKGSFEGWMKRVLINTAIDVVKKKGEKQVDINSINPLQVNRDHVEDEEMGGAELDRQDVGKHMDFNHVEQAQLSQEDLIESLRELKAEYRVVFNLHVLEGKKHKEIAELLEIDENTSRTRLNRARQKLQAIVYEKSIERITK